jgi:hypothetical protein
MTVPVISVGVAHDELLLAVELDVEVEAALDAASDAAVLPEVDASDSVELVAVDMEVVAVAPFVLDRTTLELPRALDAELVLDPARDVPVSARATVASGALASGEVASMLPMPPMSWQPVAQARHAPAAMTELRPPAMPLRSRRSGGSGCGRAPSSTSGGSR